MGRRAYCRGKCGGHPAAPNSLSSLGNKLGIRRLTVTSTFVVLFAAGCGTAPVPSASEALPSETTTAAPITAPETTVTETTAPLPTKAGIPAIAPRLLATTAPTPRATVPVLVIRHPHPTPAPLAPAPSHAPAASQPTVTAQARALPWALASSLPTGPEVTADGVSAQLKIGSCLAHSDPASIPQLVPCSGLHTDEITHIEDLTARFPEMTQDNVQTVGDEVCPAALRAWTGGDEPRYTYDFGSVGWNFVCFAALATHAPFTGTLKGAVSK